MTPLSRLDRLDLPSAAGLRTETYRDAPRARASTALGNLGPFDDGGSYHQSNMPVTSGPQRLPEPAVEVTAGVRCYSPVTLCFREECDVTT
jgi:hypothetical protein